jgi:hypothetical protein
MSYEEKYIKYKTKYLQLANKIQNKNSIQKGGDGDYKPIEIRIPDGTDQIQPQESSGCGRHALNNLFRNPNNSNQLEALFIKGGKNDKIDLDSERPDNKISLTGICSLIAPPNSNYCPDNENYDTTVLTFALMYAGYEVDETGYEINNDNLTQENQNKEIIICKSIDSIGGIVNYGSGHWISIVKNINTDKWYSYNSTGSEKTEFNNFEEYFAKNKDKIAQILFIKIPDKVKTKDNLTEIINQNKQAVETPVETKPDKVKTKDNLTEIININKQVEEKPVETKPSPTLTLTPTPRLMPIPTSISTGLFLPQMLINPLPNVFNQQNKGPNIIINGSSSSSDSDKKHKKNKRELNEKNYNIKIV